MRDDELRTLLQSADAAVETPKVGGDLAGQVRTRAARQRRRHRTAGSVAAIVLLAAGLSLWPWNVSSDQDALIADGDAFVPAAQPAASPEEVAALRAEIAAVREETAALLAQLQANRLEREAIRPARTRAVVVPVDSLKESIEQVAFIIVHQGDQMLEDQDDRPGAIEAYRRAIELFPKTSWAEVARKKLETLQSEQGV